LFYSLGYKVRKDPAEAVRWYRKAALQGHAIAQYNLGKCYDYGFGVEKKPAEAVRWYRKAAEQGDAHARKRLKEMGVPFILVKRAVTQPSSVPPGGKFDLVMEFTVHDSGNKRRQVSANYTYQILKGAKVLFGSEAKNIKVLEGSPATRTDPLRAGKKRGSYHIKVDLTYKGASAQKTVELRIE
jgi:hypothetical protein